MDRRILNPAFMGIEIISALYRLYPNDFKLESTLGLVGARWIIDEIRYGHDPQSIALKWEKTRDEFCAMRAKYLLY
jgi:uncharacterized protein YbbC (DUF1343 family)